MPGVGIGPSWRGSFETEKYKDALSSTAKKRQAQNPRKNKMTTHSTKEQRPWTQEQPMMSEVDSGDIRAIDVRGGWMTEDQPKSGKRTS
jgi:hypothetical protein